MAERIVVLGANNHGVIDAIEIPSAGDASALLGSGIVRVSLTKYGGPLANATVLSWGQEYFGIVRDECGGDDGAALDLWWKRVQGILRIARPKVIEFTVPLAETELAA